MSKADAKKFLSHAKKDPDIQKSIESRRRAVADHAKKLGLKFTEKDLKDALTEKWKDGDGTDFCLSEPPGK